VIPQGHLPGDRLRPQDPEGPDEGGGSLRSDGLAWLHRVYGRRPNYVVHVPHLPHEPGQGQGVLNVNCV